MVLVLAYAVHGLWNNTSAARLRPAHAHDTTPLAKRWSHRPQAHTYQIHKLPRGVVEPIGAPLVQVRLRERHKHCPPGTRAVMSTEASPRRPHLVRRR
jgi:hypothetical protein